MKPAYCSKRFAVLLLPVIAFGLTRCATTSQSTYYAPNSVFIPNLEQQHDATLSGGIARGNRHAGWEVQAAYSPVKHLGIMVNHLSGKTVSNNGYYYYYGNEQARKGRLNFTEGSVGAYFPQSSQTTLSCWAGYGQGSVTNYYYYYDPTVSFPPYPTVDNVNVQADLSYRRWFIQPSMLFKRRFLRMGCALRLSRIEYTHANIDYRLPAEELAATERIRDKGIFFQPELAYSLQLDFRPFTLGYNFVSRIGPDRREEYHFSGTNLAVSLGCDLQAFWRKEKVRKKKGE